MKKFVVATLLAVASVSMYHSAVAQQAVNLGAGTSAVTLSPAEYTDYNAAISQTTPQTMAPALEAYLTKYPQSQVKSDVLQRLMVAYSSFDAAKSIDAADRLLQIDPNNLRALFVETVLRKGAADAITDPTQKQAALDTAAGFAQKGLTVTKPKDMAQGDFDTLKTQATPSFYSVIGAAALNKKDTATAIDAYKKELASVPLAQTQAVGQQLQDTFFLGSAYLQSTPPDLVNCSFYTARFVAYAPEPYKSQMLPTAQYCYKKYHGDMTGYEAVTAAAQANLNPPPGFSITPAPSAKDIADKTVATTPDLATLALSDKEYILANGSPASADKVFDSVKGKSYKYDDTTVIAATANQLQVAVSDDAVQTKTADFTFNFTEPLKTVPDVGSKITLTGTFASYTQNPTMIVMSDASVVEPKKAPVKRTTPARRTTSR